MNPDKGDKVGGTPVKGWLILAVVYFASLMAPIAQFKIPALSSWLIPELGLDGVSLGALMSCLTLMGAILAFPATFVSRRFGLKATTVLALACLALGTLICATGSNVWLLYVGRLVEGLGIGLVGVSAPSCISVWFPEKSRGLALGLWSTWVPLGMVLTFNLAPMVAEAFGWRAVFYASFALAVIALVLFAVLFHMPEFVEDSTPGRDALAGSLVLLKNRGIWTLGLSFFAFSFILLGVINSFYNTFLEVGQGMSAQEASSAASVVSLLGLFAIPMSGFISDHVRFGYKKYWVALAFFAFMIGFAFAWKTGENAGVFSWIFIALAGIGCGLSAGVSRPMAPVLMGGAAAGATMGMGVLQFCQNLGAAIGSTLFGWAWEALGWEMASSVILIPMCIIGIASSFLITTKNTKLPGDVS